MEITERPIEKSTGKEWGIVVIGSETILLSDGSVYRYMPLWYFVERFEPKKEVKQ